MPGIMFLTYLPVNLMSASEGFLPSFSVLVVYIYICIHFIYFDINMTDRLYILHICLVLKL